MSEGDRLILKNMIERKYRTYAVQRHETIEDIMEARQLELSEVEALNPGTDLDDLKAREIIKLPAQKYSAHEQYEMQGTLGSPQAFHIGSVLMNSVLAGESASSLSIQAALKQPPRMHKHIPKFRQKQVGRVFEKTWAAGHMSLSLSIHPGAHLGKKQNELTGLLKLLRRVFSNLISAGTLAISLYAFWLYRESKKAKDAAEMEKRISASRKKYEVPEGLPLPSYMASLDENDDIERAPE